MHNEAPEMRIVISRTLFAMTVFGQGSPTASQGTWKVSNRLTQYSFLGLRLKTGGSTTETRMASDFPKDPA